MDRTLFRFLQEKKPFFQDRFFYLPQDARHCFFSESFSILPKEQPVAIEYCSGNGQWILDRAQKNPSIFWVAVEKKWKRASQIWNRMSTMQLENLLVVYGEAHAFTRHFLSEGAVTEAFVNFPDPWPKRRHGKHRLIQKEFVDELSRVLKKGGKITLVTDDPIYCAVICQEICSSCAFAPEFPEPYYITEWPEYGSSFFENLWRKKGLQIHYLRFARTVQNSIVAR